MPHHLAHVIGARPDLIKAAPVIRALRERGVSQRIVYTGQQDDQGSDAFFRDLDIPQPDVNLGVGSGTRGEQTAAAMVGLEREWVADPPALVVVYGDGDKALAASLVAAKLGSPSAHVEAGLRSFDRSMPEEVNRIVSDLLAELLFTTSPEGQGRLLATGVPADRVRFVGHAGEGIADEIVDWLAAREAGGPGTAGSAA
jgi:UDP-N-acetylglucosamine 2-epimerase (non-hydrolysing)